MMEHDVVWYWVNGIDGGEWRGTGSSFAGETLDEQRDLMEQMGYVARLGRRSLGPPERHDASVADLRAAIEALESVSI